jgi:autotransporter family porin
MNKHTKNQLGNLTVLVVALMQAGVVHAGFAGAPGLQINTSTAVDPALGGDCSGSVNPATSGASNCTVAVPTASSVTITGDAVSTDVNMAGILITGDASVINTVNFSGTVTGGAASNGVNIANTAGTVTVNLASGSSIEVSNGRYGAGGAGITGANFNLANSGAVTGGAGGKYFSSNAGGAGVTGTDFTVANNGTITGGTGGMGKYGSGGTNAGGGYGYGNPGGAGGSGGAGGIGAVGGAGVSGTGFTLNNNGTVTGGVGGVGGQGGYGGNAAGGSGGSGNYGSYGVGNGGDGGIGGNGGAGGDGGTGGIGGSGSIGGVGGAGVTGTGFTLTNSGTITGGVGGVGGAGGTGGYAAGGYGGNGGQGGSGAQGAYYSMGMYMGGFWGLGGAGGDGGTGGVGGAGGTGGNGGAGGVGGVGGAGVTGTGFTLTNSGTIAGGVGGAAGAGGYGGNAAGGDAGNGGYGGSGGFVGGANGNAGAVGAYGSNGTNGANGIAGAGGGAGGVGVVSTGDSTIYNSGTISGGFANGGAGAQADAINLSGGNNKLVLEAGSVINGNVVSSSGAVNGGDTLALGGNVNAAGNSFSLADIGNTAQYQGFQNFQKEGTSLWTLTGAGTADWSVAAGTLHFADSMALTGAVNVANGATVSSNTAQVTGAVTNAGTLAIASGKTLTVNGNVSNTGTFRTSVTDTGYGKLQVNGDVTLGGNLDIDASTLTSANTHQGTVSGVITGNTVTGTFASYADNSALFDLAPTYTSTAVNLTFATHSNTGVFDAVNGSNNTPAFGAARALDQIITADPTGSIAGLFLPLTSIQQVSDAASQTLPLLTGGSMKVARDTLAGINRDVQGRIKSEKRGLSSGDAVAGDKHVWIKPFGSWAKQDERNGVSGYKADTHGVILGADGAPSDTLRVGGAFAYAKADVNGRSAVAPQSADVDVYQLIGYGSVSLDKRTDIDFQVDVGQNSNKGSRQITFVPSVASSSYKSQTAHVGVGIGRDFALGSKTSLTPSVRADYTWVKDKAYSESGAGALNLNVDSRSTNAFVIGVDSNLAHYLNDQTTLVANLGVGYDTINKQNAITAAFAGAPGVAFVTYGIDPSPWLARGGFGVVHQIKTGFELTGRYDAEYRESFLNQTVSVKARWAF